ncbi:MAG TPA: secondary thiamine-phosphate synthase enzyme YjbQ [Nitrospiria bacterium]|jgi:secondary thiamine-phosphate synthase enzyme
MNATFLKIKTNDSHQVVDITRKVNQVLQQGNIQNGSCHLFIQHTTAALTVGEVGEGTEDDLLDVLNAMIPKILFRHAHDPTHAPSHMIASILGPSLTVPIAGGNLCLGTWQSILLVELDGPRERKISIKLFREEGV